MDKLLRWFRGYIGVRLYGHQVNRFINLCSKNGIHLWNITHDLHHYIRAHFRLRDFYILKPFLRKTKTKLKIISRHGFPFWCHRHPRLKWFPVLLIIILCLLVYSRSYIWEIQIQGNEKIPEHELLQVLEEHNVTVGQKSNVLDCTALEYEIRKKFSDIGWISIYLENTKLYIDIRESLYGEQEEIVADGKRYDLIANKDAYIHTMVTRCGTSVVESDMYIKKGDLLVKGTFDVLDDSGAIKQTKKVRAEAYILGDVVYNFCVPITEIEIMALKLSDHYTDVALYRIGNEKLSYFLDILEKNGVIILNKSVMIEKKEKSIVFYAKIYAREQIGTNILVEEVLEE